MNLRSLMGGMLSAVMLACTATPPAEDGLWTVAQNPVRLPTADKSVGTLRLLPAATIESLPRLATAKAVHVRAEAVDSVTWHLPTAVTAASGAQPASGVGHLEPHPDDPRTRIVRFEPELPQGLVLLRVTGGAQAGTYAVVIGDSHDWAMAEGRSWFALGQYERARDAFARATDLDGSPQSYWQLGTTEIQLKHYEQALTSAKKAYSEAKDADMDIVEYAALVGEARMLSGDYHGGLEEFEQVRKQFPTDPRADRVLGRLLASVTPSAESLAEQVYAAAARQGADGVEDMVYPPDLEQRGDAGLALFVQFLTRYGRVVKFQVVETRRFGRSATVSYKIRFSDGTAFDRSMDFFLDDAGAYKVRLPAY